MSRFKSALLVFSVALFSLGILSAASPEHSTINCYFRSKQHSSQKKIVKLSEVLQRIEFSDVIGTGFGGGSSIDGQILDEGKLVLIKISSGMKNKKSDHLTTEFHYIDSTVLPREIPVKAGMLQGHIVVEKGKP